MSYDLMVFDPSVAPRDRAAFKAWYVKQVDESSFDLETSSDGLKSWYEAMSPNWPNMQEIDDDQVDNPRVTGYSICPHAIYVDFRWSVADEAYEATRRLAVDCGVGFYDVSGDEGDGEIYFPGDELRPPSGGAWREIAADFRQAEGAPPQKRSWLDIFRRNK